MEQLGSQERDFHEILYLSIFRKYLKNIQISLQSDNNNGTLHADKCTLLIIPR